ncbi:hypothetical protein FCL47_04730 [Desulfopila sp. IMCC35006]|uniref:hypothetical protein n=1 Tax=Desulfopila sp. IMCC35006 TaxID=2569542 RepID=UPI0010AD1D7E|nr:hypothetical protein [Desulfopila sp. IMCC35006]TKB27448.1 hypothetical protein FCL47_04730 [Desulfopila sp. IMCC35006]
MAKYQPYPNSHDQFIPVFFIKQIQEGTFAYSLCYLIDSKLDLCFSDQRFPNNATDAPVFQDIGNIMGRAANTFDQSASDNGAVWSTP